MAIGRREESRTMRAASKNTADWTSADGGDGPLSYPE